MFKILIIAFLLSSCALMGIQTDSGNGTSKAISYYETDLYNPPPMNTDFKVSQEYFKPENLKSYRKDFCKKLSKEKCETEYSKMYINRILLEYPLVDKQEFASHCRAYQKECLNFTYLEQYFMRKQYLKEVDIGLAENKARREQRDRVIQDLNNSAPTYTNCSKDYNGNYNCRTSK